LLINNKSLKFNFNIAFQFFVKPQSNAPGRHNIYNIIFDNGAVLSIDAVASNPPSEIPVPAAVWLFGSGLLGLVGVARRKK
jgi:hypothetical protein